MSVLKRLWIFSSLLFTLFAAIPVHATISIVAHQYNAGAGACAAGGGTGVKSCSETLVVQHTGDAIYANVSACFSGSPGCTVAETLTAMDGTNTYSNITAATISGTSWNSATFIALNVTAGTYTLKFENNGGLNGYYWIDEEVELSGVLTSSAVDTAVSNTATSTGTAVSVTSAGNVTGAGEIVLTTVTTQAAITNTGTYTEIDNDVTYASYYKLNPTSGATTTCAVTNASSTIWFFNMVALEPASVASVVPRRR